MVFHTEDMTSGRMLARFRAAGAAWSWPDLAAFLLLTAIALLIFHAVGEMGGPISRLQIEPVVLDPSRLPEYALRSVLRMFAAIPAASSLRLRSTFRSHAIA